MGGGAGRAPSRADPGPGGLARSTGCGAGWTRRRRCTSALTSTRRWAGAIRRGQQPQRAGAGAQVAGRIRASGSALLSLDIWEKALGPTSRVATSLNNLALVLFAQDRYAGGAVVRTRDRDQEAGYASRPGKTLDNYAALLGETGRRRAARPLEDRAGRSAPQHMGQPRASGTASGSPANLSVDVTLPASSSSSAAGLTASRMRAWGSSRLLGLRPAHAAAYERWLKRLVEIRPCRPIPRAATTWRAGRRRRGRSPAWAAGAHRERAAIRCCWASSGSAGSPTLALQPPRRAAVRPRGRGWHRALQFRAEGRPLLRARDHR
jgi:hypothetical protein